MKEGRLQRNLKTRFIGWNFIRPISLFVILFGFSYVLEIIGFLVSVFILIFLMFLVSEPKKWRLYFFAALIIANLSFVLFYKLLKVQLPTGIFKIAW